MIVVVEGEPSQERMKLADRLATRFQGRLVRVSDLLYMRSEEDAIDRVADLFQDYDPCGRVMVVENENVPVSEFGYRLKMVRYLALKSGAAFWSDDRVENNDAAVMRLRRANANGLGCPSPDYVIVCAGTPRARWRALPMSYHNPSSELFWETIGDFRNIYVLNTDHDELRIILGVKNPPKVVALGSQASEWLVKISVPHQLVEHPSSILKFKSKELLEKWNKTLRKSIGR